jgi:hypothetical protein
MPNFSKPYSPEYLLRALANDEGYDNIDVFAQEVGLDSVQPGICQECCATASRMEPDQREGYCEECGNNTVISASELYWEVA